MKTTTKSLTCHYCKRTHSDDLSSQCRICKIVICDGCDTKGIMRGGTCSDPDCIEADNER